MLSKGQPTNQYSRPANETRVKYLTEKKNNDDDDTIRECRRRTKKLKGTGAESRGEDE